MPDIFETILHRRSIRRFEPKQIEEAALQQILQAGLYAPNAGGRPLTIPVDREFCGNGTFLPTTTPLCSFFWVIPVRATSTLPRSREKRGV